MKLLLVVFGIRLLAQLFGSKDAAERNDGEVVKNGHAQHPAGFALR